MNSLFTPHFTLYQELERMNGDGIVGRVRNSTSGASLLNGLNGTLNTLQNAASVATLGALPRSPSSSSKVKSWAATRPVALARDPGP